jgi:hypothetical protein
MLKEKKNHCKRGMREKEFGRKYPNKKTSFDFDKFVFVRGV